MVVSSAAFSPDGKRIVTASEDSTARLWDAETGKPIGEPLKGHEGAHVHSAAFSPDGKRIVTASDGQDGAAVGRPRPASQSASRSKAIRSVVYERGVQPRRQAHRHRV